MTTPEEGLRAWMPSLLATFRDLCRAKDRDHGPRYGRERGRGGSPRPKGSEKREGPTLSREELAQVASAVARLSRGLTRERELAGARYLDEPRLLGAYLLYYWPVSYLQARGVFSELPRRPRTVLDLGGGPGPVAFAALDAGAAQVTVADRSTRALEAAVLLARAAGEPIATRNWKGTSGEPLSRLTSGGRVDLVTMGHVLNELFRGAADPEAERVRLIEEALELLNPGGSLVVVEPALRETSRALLRVRDRLVARGHAVRAPCLYRGNCPALVRESDWCHAERRVEPPSLVLEIARAAGLNREAVKMSYLVLAAKDENWPDLPPGRLFRIVSEPLPSKGRLRYMGCGPEGRMGLALQEKHVRKGNQSFASLKRGDVVEIGGALPRGDGLALGEDSSVRIVAAAGQALPSSEGRSPKEDREVDRR